MTLFLFILFYFIKNNLLTLIVIQNFNWSLEIYDKGHVKSKKR